MSAPFLEVSRNLGVLSQLASTPAEIDRVIGGALEALRAVVPYDLATVMQLDDGVLTVRVARGHLDGPAIRQHRLRLADFPSLREVLATGEPRAFTEHEHRHGDGDPFDGVLDLPEGHFCMVAPLRAHERNFGVLSLDRTTCGVYSPAVLRLVGVFGQLLALAINYGEQSGRLERLRRQLAEQNRLLTEQTRGPLSPAELVEGCRSPAMVHAVRLARQVAPTEAPVLITGETGTGKEVLAHALHAWSDRAGGPFVAVNCAALPHALIESELFGHVKGAFTGATGSRLGRFQAAHGGILFLDEIGELPLELQAKLLRVLQDGSFEPVGSDRTVSVDVRVVAATNRALQERVADGAFREDLYYRLAVFPIQVPPLRARAEDIGVLAEKILDGIARRTGRGPWRLSAGDLELLRGRRWPGNVRELVNALERATILAAGERLVFHEAAPTASAPTPAPAAPFATLGQVQADHIRAALARAEGRIAGPGGAAELLAVHPSTLRSRMQKLGVRP